MMDSEINIKNNQELRVFYEKELDKEAYSTLADWAKSAPRIIKQLEAEGKKDELKKFKLQIKLVVNKLQDIKEILKKTQMKQVDLRLYIFTFSYWSNYKLCI